MTFTVRSARPEDLESIAGWTQDTFAWGDYVPERFAEWVADPESEVMVCVGEDDVPVALAHARMLSGTEGWLEGARVHPDHRRMGMGKALNTAGVAWAGRRGARVVRLAMEEENSAARSQVESLGYRLGSTWVAGFLTTAHQDVTIATHRLEPSSSLDLDSAWMSWSAGDLVRPGRGLLNIGWQWRAATVTDLEEAIADGRLYQSAAGWVMFRAGRPDTVESMWLSTSAAEFPALLQGILHDAATRRAEHVEVKMPAVEWAAESLRREGFRVNEILVYYKAV
jgi:GNAT superfamily N-acetyltransferase